MAEYNKDVRSVLKHGDSLAVTLPYEYVVKKGLKPGDKVEVLWNDFVFIEPVRPEEIRKRMEKVK